MTDTQKMAQKIAGDALASLAYDAVGEAAHADPRAFAALGRGGRARVRAELDRLVDALRAGRATIPAD